MTPAIGVSNGIWAADAFFIGGLMDSVSPMGAEAQVVVSLDGVDWERVPLPDSSSKPLCDDGGCQLVFGQFVGDTIFLPFGEGMTRRDVMVGRQQVDQ